MMSFFRRWLRRLTEIRTVTAHPDEQVGDEWFEQLHKPAVEKPALQKVLNSAPDTASQIHAEDENLHPDLHLIHDDSGNIFNPGASEPISDRHYFSSSPAVSDLGPAQADQPLTPSLRVDLSESKGAQATRDLAAPPESNGDGSLTYDQELAVHQTGRDAPEGDLFTHDFDHFAGYYSTSYIPDDPIFDSDFEDDDSQPQQLESPSPPWEHLLPLELPDADLPLAEDIADDFFSPAGRLEQYAAELVNKVDIINSSSRAVLHRRFRSILDDFPFHSSFQALSRLLASGASPDELEDACALKCMWRDSPWLWLERRFDRMCNVWQIDRNLVHRNSFTWQLASQLVRRSGRSEAERNLAEDWLTEWQAFDRRYPNASRRVDASFFSYSAYLQYRADGFQMRDPEGWFYEEPADRQAINSLHIEQEDGNVVWSFEPKDAVRDTGCLSRAPLTPKSRNGGVRGYYHCRSH
ncbi:hypothetical protein SH611_06260 [Geminicoccaceae bacterium 1502E]|nr:hypothetical protein [Geminicoccaceae bacterium 1502E]